MELIRSYNDRKDIKKAKKNIGTHILERKEILENY